MFNSILVVCTGNICRSPIGERYLRNLLPDKKSIQQGLEHLLSMRLIIVRLRLLSSMGFLWRAPLGQFTSSLGRQYDLILAMEKSHIEQIGHIAPEAGENDAIWSLVGATRYT